MSIIYATGEWLIRKRNAKWHRKERRLAGDSIIGETGRNIFYDLGV